MVTQELRAKEARVSRATERYRRNRILDPHHWHYRLYTAWLRTKNPAKKPQLNFCHYWRVVLLWALPRLLWARVLVPLGARLLSTILRRVLACLGVMAVFGGFGFALIAFEEVRNAFAWIVIIVGGGLGLLITTNYWWCVAMDGGYRAWVNLRKAPKWWGRPTLIVFSLPAMALVLGTMIVMSLVAGLVWIFEESGWPQRVWRGFVATMGALDKHPPNRPLVRPWVILGVVAGTAWVSMAMQSYDIPVALFAAFVAVECITIGFISALLFVAAERRAIKREVREKTAIFNIIGFRTWLWNDNASEAEQFRWNYAHKFTRGAETLPAELAAGVDLDDARSYLYEFLRSRPLPMSQLGTIPKRLVPRPVRPKRTTPTAWQRWVAFWGATWAFVRLMWAGMVFVKRVGACPTLSIKEADTEPPATNEQSVTA